MLTLFWHPKQSYEYSFMTDLCLCSWQNCIRGKCSSAFTEELGWYIKSWYSCRQSDFCSLPGSCGYSYWLRWKQTKSHTLNPTCHAIRTLAEVAGRTIHPGSCRSNEDNACTCKRCSRQWDGASSLWVNVAGVLPSHWIFSDCIIVTGGNPYAKPFLFNPLCKSYFFVLWHTWLILFIFLD